MKKGAKKLTILVATGIYPPDIGGPATYTRQIEEELPKHDIAVRVVSFGPVRRYPKGISHLIYFFKLLKSAFGVNVIYALDPVSTGLPALIASKILRKKFLLRLGGDYAWEMASLKYSITETPLEYVSKMDSYPTPIKVLRKIETLVARNASKVFTQSKYTKKVIEAWGIEGDKVVVIYNGFKEPKNIAKKNVLRKMMNWSGKIAISVGRLIPLKGFKELILCAPEILKKYPDFKLVIVGGGEEGEALETLIKKKGLEKQVLLTGVLPKEVLYGYIKAADVLVQNVRHETFPNLLLEAMAIGTPVLTTNVGGNPEIISDGKDGTLVSLGDKKELINSIGKFLSDKAFTEKITQNARTKVRRFNIENATGALVKELLI